MITWLIRYFTHRKDTQMTTQTQNQPVETEVDVLDTLAAGIGGVETSIRELRRSKGDVTTATGARAAAELRLTEAKAAATAAETVVGDKATVVGAAIDTLIDTLKSVKATL